MPRLEEYVQQGNIRSIIYIVKGVPFSSFIKRKYIKNILKETICLKICRVLGSRKKYFNLILSNFCPECGRAQLILPLFVSFNELTA